MGRRVMREWVAVEAPERILPTIFYILTLLAYFTHHAGILFVVLVWVFVIFRPYTHPCMSRAISPIYAACCSVLAPWSWRSCGLIFIIQVLTQP